MFAFAPLAIGAVQPWSMYVLEASVSILLTLWALQQFFAGRIVIVKNPLFLPMSLFAACVIVQLLLHITAYWYATWSKSLLYASYAGIIFLTTQVFYSQKRSLLLAYFLSVYGFLVALFAIVQQFTSNGKIYWTILNQHGGWIYGPYVNHAHYAGLMELLIPFPIVLALESRDSGISRLLFLFASIVMASTIFLCLSLGGMIAFAIELAALSLILLRNKRSANREILVLGILCVALAAWLVWLRPEGLIERLARLLNPIADAGATGRVAIVKDSFRMLLHRPILGWGLGTFSTVYPTFRSFFTNLWVNEAHNDYVQTLVETGIVGFSSAIFFLVVLFREGIRTLKARRDQASFVVSLAAFLGCIGILAHGFVDFNLQIPANAALFFALAAIVTARRSRMIPDETQGS